MPRTLRAQCVGRPRSGAYRNVIQRLSCGKLPTEGHERHVDGEGEVERRPWDEASDGEGRERRTRSSRAWSNGDENAGSVLRRVRRRWTTVVADRDKRLRDEVAEELASHKRRRRSKGKWSHEHPASITAAVCDRLSQGSATGRIRVSATARAMPCVACSAPTKAHCRGCLRAFCLSCAKSKRRCAVSAVSV